MLTLGKLAEVLGAELVGNADHIPETLLAQLACAATEHLLRCMVGLHDEIILVEQQYGEDQRGDLGTRVGYARACGHAARRCVKGS